MISSGLAAGSLLADTAGTASFSFLSGALQAGGAATRTIFQHVDTTLERAEEVSTDCTIVLPTTGRTATDSSTGLR